jgi:PAS domain S-box-containing protein
MNTYTGEISEVYRSTLESYLSGDGESALHAAYEMGRRAVAEELGSVELITIHQESLPELLKSARTIQDAARIIDSSWDFLRESLSPFEMTIRGYREALNSLKISEEMFRTLIDTARDVIYTISPDGMIRSLNPYFEEITGYRREEWIGKSFTPLIHPGDLDQAQSLFRRVLNGETPPVFELRIRAKSGAYLTGEFTTTPQRLNGSVTGAFGIARDVTERRKAQEQMRALAKRVVNAQEDERRRIARELHDDLCQWLSGTKLSLNILEEKPPAARTLRKKLRTLKEEVNQKIVEVRRMAVSLRPAALDDFGLVMALPRLCAENIEHYNIPTGFESEGSPPSHYPPEVETALYRIAQEALSNLGKHSQASKGTVKIAHTKESVSLEISDNGAGFNQAEVAAQRTAGAHLGLVSMNERATLLGGTFSVDSQPGRGTTIRVEIPLELFRDEKNKNHLR